MKEFKRLTGKQIRNLCCENDYFTRGDNTTYSNLMDYAEEKEEITLEDLKYIATVIKENSDTEAEVMNIVNQLNYKCYRWIEE